MKNNNKWDNTVPVEKSSYLNDDDIQFFNLETVKFDSNKLNMIDLFCGAGGFERGRGRGNIS